jgi:2-dehydropantoate 2-reductase
MALAVPFMEPLHVVGAGSIGLFIAASIRSAFPSYPLAVLFRDDHRTSKRFASQGDEIVVCTRQQRNTHLAGATSSTNRRRPRPHIARVPYQFIGDECTRNRSKIRNLVLCTKAYQVEDALRDIQPRLDPSNLRIVVLCNGALDVRETILRVLHGRPTSPDLVMCTTTHGVVHETALARPHDDNGGGCDPEKDDNVDDDMFHLLHVGLGQTYVGGNPTMAQLWDQSGLAAQSTPPPLMEVLLWKKLAANCVCNPLTALWGVPNGQLEVNTAFPTLRAQIVREVSRVGTLLHPEMSQALSPDSLDGFVEQVIQANWHNMSSMYHDVQNRRRTEVDNLNGYVVRKSHEMGLSCPANEVLVGMVKEAMASATSQGLHNCG